MHLIPPDNSGFLSSLLFTIALLSMAACQTQPLQTSTAAAKKIPTPIVDPTIASIRNSLTELIPKIQDKFQIQGLSLVLVNNQQTLWAEGFGYADKESHIAATQDTVYRAGSLAKPFTATAVMQLQDAHLIDIDQPLLAYLPEFSIRSRFDVIAKPITLRSILFHHSGLPTDLNKGMWSDAPFTQVAEKLKEEYTAFPPDFIFSYSNVGYTLLGHMIERVSQQPYVEYMEQKIFDPAGMNDSGMRLRPHMTSRLAKGYRDGQPAELLPIRDLPAYALHTTATDLGRFMKMMFARGKADQQTVIAAETIEEMTEAQNQDIRLDMNIINGLGWFLEKDTFDNAGLVVRHGGTTLLFSSEMIMLPERGLGIAILANSKGSRGIVSKLAEEILRLVLKDAQQIDPAALLAGDFAKEPSDAVTTDASGHYATDLGMVAIRPEDAEFCACIIEKSYSLIPYPNGWFGIGKDAVDSLPPSYQSLSEYQFQTQIIDGREIMVAKKDNKTIVLGEKIPETPIPPVWMQRIGRYEVVNQDEKFPVQDARIMLNDGQLCMRYKMPALSEQVIQVPIHPVSDTEAVILGLGRTRGETLRAVQVNGKERLHYSGYEGRQIKN